MREQVQTHEHGNMLYLSEIIGKKVYDPQGNRLGKVRDLVAELSSTMQMAGEDAEAPVVLVDTIDEAWERDVPYIKGVLARTGRKQEPFFLPVAQIESLAADGVWLNSARVDLQPHERRAGEILLRRDLWDKQVIDLDSRKVVRVNDIVLIEGKSRPSNPNRQDKASQGAQAPPGARWWVRGVDVGVGGLARRLRVTNLLQRLSGKTVNSRMVPWRHLDVFGSNVPGGVAIHHKKLARLHPVEIARITDSVSYLQGAEIIASLNDTLAADTLEEITAVRQTDIVEQIPDERAADILEEMAPDEASDLLAELPEEKAGALLDHMDEEEAKPIRHLMRYSEDSAGGIMTTDYVRVLPHMTVGEVIEANRAIFMSTDLIYYMYVVDSLENNNLVGIITVRDLLVQELECPVSSFMLKEILTARPGENKKEVARKMAEYNLLALPVVDKQGNLHGVVTVDDALDSLLPEGWQKRLPKIFS